MTGPRRAASGRAPACRDRDCERGQGLVEFAMLVPVFMLLLLGMLEFGTAFNHNLTLGYASREGARIGADLVNGGGPFGCATGQSPNAGTNGEKVDQVIIEAVDRVLTSAGSPIDLSRVDRIRLFRPDKSGNDTLNQGNDWLYTASPYTLPDFTTVNFAPSGAGTFQACSRSSVIQSSGSTAGIVDSIGVSIDYTYQMVTPLGTTLQMHDVTVMQFNPSDIKG